MDREEANGTVRYLKSKGIRASLLDGVMASGGFAVTIGSMFVATTVQQVESIINNFPKQD